MQYANFTPILNYAIHYSGAAQSDNDTKLSSDDWYYGRLQPFLTDYRKGWLVYKKSTIEQQAEDSSRCVHLLSLKVLADTAVQVLGYLQGKRLRYQRLSLHGRLLQVFQWRWFAKLQLPKRGCYGSDKGATWYGFNGRHQQGPRWPFGK